MPKVSDFVNHIEDEPQVRRRVSSSKQQISKNHSRSGQGHHRRRRPGREESAVQWIVGEFQHQRKDLMKRFKEEGAWGVAFYFVDMSFNIGKGIWRKWH